MTVDLRTGDPKSSPTDSLGPVSVNLANGNAIVRAESPTASFTRGSAGFAFTYNSQAAGPQQGLTATYYPDTDHDGVLDADEAAKQLMRRVEPQVNVDWRDQSPYPGVIDADWFHVRWEGRLTVPSTGSYTFGMAHDDSVKLTVNGSVVRQAGCCSTTPAYGTPVTLTAGRSVPISVALWEAIGATYAQLWVKGPDGVERIVPAEWLSQAEPAALPAGWTLSTDVDGTSPFVRAVVSEQNVTLVDDTGATHVWARQPAAPSTLLPPADENGVLTIAPAGSADAGQLTLVEEDGSRTTFAPDGRLLSYVPVDVTGKPAPITYEWSGSRLSRLVDSVSGLHVDLSYGVAGSADDCYAGLTAPAGTSTTAPDGKLCRIVFPDSSQTVLWYSSASDGRLMRVDDPGGETTQFGYSADGLLVSVRDPLAFDAVTAGKANNDSTSTTVITYDTGTTTGPGPRVTRVTAPTPSDAGGAAQARPEHTYTYTVPFASGVTGTTQVRVTGLSPAPATGWARQVTFNDRLQGLTDTDATGVVTTTSYRADDLLEKVVDGAGRVTTTVYDGAGRPVGSYGPAPAACFNGLLPVANPVSSCGSRVPASTTGYDEGMSGLHVVWFNNTSLTGAPVAQTLGLPSAAPGTPLAAAWGTGSPIPGVSADSFSARATGYLTYPVGGEYAFTLTADDSARLWLDDVLVADQTPMGPGKPITVRVTNTRGAGAMVPIRLELTETTGAASVSLTWAPPGQTNQAVPATALAPGYGLVTTTTTADDGTAGNGTPGTGTASPSEVTRTGYGPKPWEGLAQTSTVDPDGLALATQLRYDDLHRRTARALPAGNIDDPAARYSDSYYANTEAVANPCMGGSARVNQAGRLKTTTSPTGSDGRRVVRESVYDLAGRVVASRTRNLAADGTPAADGEAWTCTSYDARGRVSKVSYPAHADQTARTVTTSYAVGGNPLVTSVTDPAGTITTTVDVLGRPLTYTDVWGVATTTRYDRAGRVTATTTTPPGGTPATTSFTYDPAGRPLTVTDATTVTATAGYDTAGEPTTVAYGNGSSVRVGRDGTGATTRQAYTFPAGQQPVTDEVTRSRAGKVLTSAITDGPTSTLSSYGYDPAGRLTAAAIPGHQLAYDYTTTDACTGVPGAVPASGRNGNRVRASDTPDGGTATVTSSCYDAADRLIATTVAGAPAGANRVTGTDLTTSGTGATLRYDAHGNTTRLADQVLGYDAADRHLTTATDDGTTVTYTRDATDRIVARTAKSSEGQTTVVRYGHTGGSDTADLTLTGSNGLVERVLALPGGVVLTHRPDGQADVWAYPNIHGDVIVTADPTGTRQGPVTAYDPFGQPVDPTTRAIGTSTADDAVPDTITGELDNGWLGQHQRPYEHAGTLATIEMGARQYVPTLGRFLQVDPIEGGTDNDYTYVTDPISSYDLDGHAYVRPCMCGGGSVGRGASASRGPNGTVRGGFGVRPPTRFVRPSKAPSFRSTQYKYIFSSREAATRQARADARLGGPRAVFRDTCAPGGCHVHVDYRNKHGQILETVHYVWRSGGARGQRKPV